MVVTVPFARQPTEEQSPAVACYHRGVSEDDRRKRRPRLVAADGHMVYGDDPDAPWQVALWAVKRHIARKKEAGEPTAVATAKMHEYVAMLAFQQGGLAAIGALRETKEIPTRILAQAAGYQTAAELRRALAALSTRSR